VAPSGGRNGRASNDNHVSGPSSEVHAPVRAVVRVTKGLSYVFPYRGGGWLWERCRCPSAAWAFAYEPAWIGALTIILLTGVARTPSGFAWLLVVAAGYRLSEIVNFFAGLFLNKDQERLRGVERSLLLLLGNLVEVTLATAILLTAAYQTSPSRAWDDAFFLVTFMAVPDRPGRYSHLVEMVGISAALMLVAGGLGMLLGLIGDRFAQAAGTSQVAAPEVPEPTQNPASSS
jgi:hypothetical protein